jgi:hypothetical protein
MGVWGTEPWDNDSAADWFSQVFKNVDIDVYIEKALKYKYDNYNEVRAAAYLLDVLGVSYIWPGNLEKLKCHMENAIDILKAMIDSNSDDDMMDFLELWDNNPEVISSVKNQITSLEQKLKKII